MTLRIEKLEAFVYRAPIDTPVQTSFGTLRDRPAVFVRATDADGVQGWGEVWCNFPTIGAEHRVQAQDRPGVGQVEADGQYRSDRRRRDQPAHGVVVADFVHHGQQRVPFPLHEGT